MEQIKRKVGKSFNAARIAATKTTQTVDLHYRDVN